MSINHYSMDLPEATIWWNQNQNQNQTQTTPFPNYPSPTQALANNQNDTLPDQNDNDDEDQENDSATPRTQSEDEKEAMFEKPLTPSDVGKLNRLVIPKQHAEKYFPLADSPECKGLLLSFEDESGKCWRFRYSYWNSSQSYVLTKGWSRYVKDKRLHAGDVVLFHRHRLHAHRLFIHWRRRRPHADTPAHVSSAPKSAPASAATAAAVVVDEPWTTPFYSAHPYPAHHHALPYQHDSLHAGRGSQSQIGEEQRTRGVRNNSSSSSCSSSSRVLRLFGVNMECQPEHDSGPSTPQSLYNNNYNMPSTLDHSHHFYHHHHHQPSNSHPHMLRHQPYYY